MYLNAFAGLSGAFILTFFDLTCYISVYSIFSIRAHTLISTRPRISAQPTGHYVKQAPLSNKPLSPPHDFPKIVAIQEEWEDLFIDDEENLEDKERSDRA